MREFDLQRALLRFRAAAKDFQDQAGAIKHLGVPGLFQVSLLNRRQRAIHHDQLDVMAGDETDNLLDLALAEIGRGANLSDRRNQRVRDLEIDGARKPRGLVKPRLEIAQGVPIRLRLAAAAHPQIRADDNPPPACFGPCRPRTVSTPFPIPRFQSIHSQAGASSPPSNNWIGAPGMMVEIACLYTSCE